MVTQEDYDETIAAAKKRLAEMKKVDGEVIDG